MQEINYRQEFPLVVRFYYKDEQGNLQPFGFPPYDFKIYFWTTSRSDTYTVSCRYVDGEPVYLNCKRKGDDLVVIFDNHRLNPGELRAEMVMDVPSDLYPDGYRRDVLIIFTETRLIHGPTPSPTRAEINAILPYIIGKDGKDGKDGENGKDGKDGKDFNYDELTEEQKKEMAKKVAENIDTNMDGILENITSEEFDSMFED